MVAMLCPGIISDQATPLLCKALFECAHTHFWYAGDSAVWSIVKLHAWAHWWSAFVQLSYHYLLSTLCVNGVTNYSRPSSAFPCSNWQKAGRSLRTRLIRGHFCEILHHQKIFRRICKVRYCKSFKLKNNYNSQRRLVWRAKNYFGPLGAPCLERHLRIRAQLAPFQWTCEVCMATLTTDKLEYVIPGCRKYKRVWSPGQRLNSRRTSSLESRTSHVQNLSK